MSYIGDPGVPATPLIEPYKSYQDMGGKLSEAEFVENLSEIRHCREILCGIPCEDACGTYSLPGFWLSIWAEIHTEECYPGSKRKKLSRFLAGNQTKEESFFLLICFAYELFCSKASSDPISISPRYDLLGDPGPSPNFDPFQIYQEMGGQLSQPEFWNKLSDIRRCKEKLCEFSEEEICNIPSLQQCWISIWEAIDPDRCFHVVRKAGCSMFLEGTQTKGGVFWRLVSLVHGLFCYSSVSESSFDAMFERRFCRCKGQTEGER